MIGRSKFNPFTWVYVVRSDSDDGLRLIRRYRTWLDWGLIIVDHP